MASDPLTRATASLYGLALGDALGSQFFVPANREALTTRTLPPGPWQWTDDTEMACSVYRLLADRGMVDQDALAASFAAHHDFDRGYGPATGRMLRLVREGGDWRVGDAYDRLLLELLVDTILLQRHDPRRWDELASLR
ncbi:ADP-ribosylglycohydrolase family protein [Microbispora rosea]|uniref:ADP-ribosylglycohydrolase family protein n=1 Tax=Microbispora rosea TaxID=58117 RepID=UPI003D904F87